MRRSILLSLLVAGTLAANTSALAQTPEIIYETFLPGYTLPHARDIVVDEEGNAFVIGSAYADGVSLDVLVVKLDPTGDELWNVYIEASEHDYATGLALDSAGGLWVTGFTDSPDFPVVNPLDDSLTGFRDVFLIKLASSDGNILYSTFIGGDYADTGNAIAINSADEIYLTGVAGSTDFPTTEDAYQPEPSFPLYFYQDAFIAKLSPGGDEILYSTYFGGTQDDWGDRIALDADDNIIIAGRTSADDFPLVDAYDTTPNGHFVSKLSADGSTLLFSTYFGGSDYDKLGGMVSDGSGNVYLVGSTQSVDFPTTPGAFQETFVGAINGCEIPFGGDYNCDDFFVSKLSTSGAGMLWSTFIGGTSIDKARSVAYDALGNVYVAGYTSSDDFPDVEFGFIGAQIVVCKLTNNGSNLDFTLGVDSGSANRGNGICVDGEGDVYFSGTVGVPASVYVSKFEGESTTAAGDGSVAALMALALETNHPNPFNLATSISYSIPESAGVAHVNLSVFDVRGRLVKQLVDEPQAAGNYAVIWRGLDEQGTRASAGVYFYHLRWGSESLTRSMVMLK